MARWTYREASFPPSASLIERVSAVRGFADEEARAEFLAPSFSALYSPLLFKQMPLAVSRFLKAREDGERIAIVGDYDADGITATALLYRLFAALAMPPPLVFLPHRLHDGYGLTPDLVTRAIAGGASLILTVDTGISGAEAAALAREKGADVIITDHHQVIGELPVCHAIIDPWVEGEGYPFKELAGVGVAYKFAAAVLARALPAAEAERFLKWSFDLVALGTIADLVPLVDENRIFVSQGLKVIERPRSLGLKALLNVCRLTSPINTEMVSYRIAPRINAAGRIADPQCALDLLLEEGDEEKCMLMARDLDRLNTERQNLVQSAMKEVDKSISRRDREERLLIAKSSSWPHGIIGLIAGKLSERYLLPVIALSNSYDPEVYVASCRSRPGLDVTDFIDHFREMFIRGGGHAAAGGFSLSSDRLPLFEEKAYSWASEHWQDAPEDTPLLIDFEIAGADCTYENAKELQRLAPFGAGNPEPVFALSGARVESVRMLGGQGQHRQMRVRARDRSSVETITFHLARAALTFQAGDTVSLAGSLRTNTYNGARRVQFMIQDARQGAAGAQT